MIFTPIHNSPFIGLFLITMIINVTYPKINFRTSSLKLLLDSLLMLFAFIAYWGCIALVSSLVGFNTDLLIIDLGSYLNPIVIAFTVFIAFQMVVLRQMSSMKIKFRILFFVVSTVAYFQILIIFSIEYMYFSIIAELF